MLGLKEAGFAEIEHDYYFNENKLRLLQIIGTTFSNSRRITLLCNGTSQGIGNARKAFSYIKNTMLFTY